MSKATTHLTDAAVRGFKAPGRYPDGSALWLQVTRAVDGASVRKSWIVRVRPPYLDPEGKISRRPRDLGLGTWPSVSLADARQKAQEAREIAKTRDPLEARAESVRAVLQSQRDAEAGVAPRALELAIICGSRANEVLNARVDEFDLDKAEWRIPAGRMKAGREHKIPLTPRAVEIVRAALKDPAQTYVFTGAKPGRPLSNMAMLQTLRRMGVAVTQHGFRAAMATWAGEQTAFPREVILRAIAHVVGSASDQSYERGDQFQRRRDLMLTWQSHLDGKAGADVLPFPKAGAQ